ncbi:MAG: SDH family Clp fold serine proteinase [Dictyoglomus turgidum]
MAERVHLIEKKLKLVGLILAASFVISGLLIGNFATVYQNYELDKAVQSYEEKHNAKVLFLIHKRKTFSFFSFNIFESLEVEDAHKILKALEGITPEKNLLIVVHTPGGELYPAVQIAKVLSSWKADVKVVVPYYAMSAGTLIALSAKEIIMSPFATLGPVDPQIITRQGSSIPATALIDVTKTLGVDKLSSEYLVYWSISRRAVTQLESFLRKEILGGKTDKQKETIIQRLLYPFTTHDYPVFPEEAQRIGLPVKVGIPEDIKRIVDYSVQVSSHLK